MTDPRRVPSTENRRSRTGRERRPGRGSIHPSGDPEQEETEEFVPSEEETFDTPPIEENIIESGPEQPDEPPEPSESAAMDETIEENRELRESLLRLQAEFDNYRKRQAREFERLSIHGKRSLMGELLEVLDNFDRAIAHSRENGHSHEDIAEGMFRTVDLMKKILDQEGLRELDVRPGDPFDPNIHEAMMAVETEGLKTDSILEILEKGYILNDELLRPARVKVGKPAHADDSGPDTGESSEDEEGSIEE